MQILFAGGGTAGHLFPGLAVAEQFVQLAPRSIITFAGSGKPLERRAVAAAGFRYVTVPCHPLPSRVSDAFPFVRANLAGYRAAAALIREHSPRAVVGLGGYASFPVAWAATDRRVPLLLLEQNVLPGRATRWLARRARLICTSFAKTQALLNASCPTRCVGNPLRKGFSQALHSAESQASLADRPRQLLILGGSQGAAALNEAVPKALHHIRSQLADWQIVHQTGDADRLTTERLYATLGLKARVEAFLDDLPQVMRRSQLAVSRAGGTTLAELAATAVPTLFVPLLAARDNHQHLNAEHLERAGAARLVDSSLLDALPQRLATELALLVSDDALRSLMSRRIQKLARPHAAWHVANMLRDLAGSGHSAAGRFRPERRALAAAA
jgi:UDP-N-acetylglucosamine--N-acetylmuramyl-(pentapeptide) pyrophosphoryl-undecaprenol N-acetylglucosamine transferase